jgi:NADPH:quinone reductase-like Zn-dependent oxidoreductase
VNAYYLKQYGNATTSFELREHNLPILKENEVKITVEAFGLNYADVMARNKMYREAPPLPCVLGYEVVGIVSEVGNTQNNSLLGQRVVAFTRFGGYAQEVQTRADAVVEIGQLDAGKALALATQYVTAFYMVHVATNILPEERVLVHAAAGGVGTALIQLLKLKGAVVFAKSRSDNKKDYVLKQGADHFINYSQEDYATQIKQLLDNQLLDISFNAVGGETVKKDLNLLNAGGRFFLFGGAALTGSKWGILSQLNFLRKMGIVLPIALMMKSKSILGVNMLKIADARPELMNYCLQTVVNMYQEGKINPEVGKLVHHTELAEAHQHLESGNSTGKIGILW